MKDEQEELFDLKEVSKPFKKGKEFGSSRYNESYQLLSSGRSFYAYNGVIGIGPNFTIFWGYDDRLPSYIRDERGPETFQLFDETFTPKEYMEIADVMISRWTHFKQTWTGIKGDVERAD